MYSHVYQHAECFLPWNLQHSVFNSTIFPYWSSNALYYFQQSEAERSLIRIDIQTGRKEKILGFHDLVIALFFQLKEEINPEKLPLDKFSMNENPRQLCFSYQKNKWYYDFEKRICVKGAENKPEYLQSPDGNWILQVKNHNLFLTNPKHHQDVQLTIDGERYYNYSSSQTRYILLHLFQEDSLARSLIIF